jgi:hypothetical protein
LAERVAVLSSSKEVDVKGKQTLKLLAVAGILVIVALVVIRRGNVQSPDLGENLALGKSYTMSPQPNYSYSTDPGDVVQLTDGQYTTGRLWTQITTVGWRKVSLIVISIDLGQDYPLKGLLVNTAAGFAGVHWPRAIYVLVSEDGQVWYEAGELVEMSSRHDPLPPYGTYQIHPLWTDQLETHGRYVALVIEVDEKFFFADEIEVFRGVLSKPYSGPPIADVFDFVTDPSRAHHAPRSHAWVSRHPTDDRFGARYLQTSGWCLARPGQAASAGLAETPLGPIGAFGRAGSRLSFSGG